MRGASREPRPVSAAGGEPGRRLHPGVGLAVVLATRSRRWSPGAVRRGRARADRRRAAQAGRRPRAHAVRARPGPGGARRGVPAAGGQDPGGRAADRRLRPQPAHPQPRGRPGRPRPGPRAGLPPRHRRDRGAGPRPRPPAVRPQRRAGAGRAQRATAAASRATPRRCGCSPGSRPRPSTPTARSVGLNLTRATLDACTKYPWPRADADEPRGVHADGSPRVVRKFGVYDDDLPVFDWLRDGRRRHRRRASRRR